MALLHSNSNYTIIHGNLDTEGDIYIMGDVSFISHQELIQLAPDLARDSNIPHRLVKMHPSSEVEPPNETRNVTTTSIGEYDDGSLSYKMPLSNYARGMVEFSLSNSGNMHLNRFDEMDIKVPIYYSFVERSKLAFLVETPVESLKTGDKYIIKDGICYSNRNINSARKKTIFQYEDNLLIK